MFWDAWEKCRVVTKWRQGWILLMVSVPFPGNFPSLDSSQSVPTRNSRAVCSLQTSISVLITSQKERGGGCFNVCPDVLTAELYYKFVFSVLSWQFVQNYMYFCVGFSDILHWDWSVRTEESGKDHYNTWNLFPLWRASLCHKSFSHPGGRIVWGTRTKIDLSCVCLLSSCHWCVCPWKKSCPGIKPCRAAGRQRRRKMSCQVMERASSGAWRSVLRKGLHGKDWRGGRWTVLSIDFSGESKDIAAKFGNKENRFLCISLNFWVPLVHVWAQDLHQSKLLYTHETCSKLLCTQACSRTSFKSCFASGVKHWIVFKCLC